jgi:hypothetical protein
LTATARSLPVDLVDRTTQCENDPCGFVHGEKPTGIDAAIYIADIHFYDIDTAFKRFVSAHDNIARHCNAIHVAVSA